MGLTTTGSYRLVLTLGDRMRATHPVCSLGDGRKGQQSSHARGHCQSALSEPSQELAARHVCRRLLRELTDPFKHDEPPYWKWNGILPVLLIQFQAIRFRHVRFSH